MTKLFQPVTNFATGRAPEAAIPKSAFVTGKLPSQPAPIVDALETANYPP